MVNRTAFGEMVGKFQLGTDSGGLEAALGPRFIGEAPALSLSTLDIRTPERRVGLSPLSDALLGAIIGIVLTKIIK